MAAPTQKIRKDVQRNEAALIEAAAQVFATSGVDAPAKEITDAAGLGVGTLYRRFPLRSDLVVAVLERELDECVAVAERALATMSPAEALTATLDRFTGLVRTKAGLAEALHSSDPAFEGLPERLLRRLVPAVAAILDRGAAAGVVRDALGAHDLLVAVALLCQPAPSAGPRFNERAISTLVSGLRA